MIVKVQKPITTSAAQATYLAYDEERSFMLHITIGEDPDLDEAMKDSLKRYFYASEDEVLPRVLSIDVNTPCPDQDW